MNSFSAVIIAWLNSVHKSSVCVVLNSCADGEVL